MMKAANNAAPKPNEPAQQQRRVATGWKFCPSNPNNCNSRFYRMTAAEAQEAPNAMQSMFHVNPFAQSLLGS